MNKLLGILILLFSTTQSIAGPTYSLTEMVNSYIEQSKVFDFNSEMAIGQNEKVLSMKIKAQPLSENTVIKVKLDNTTIHEVTLKGSGSEVISFDLSKIKKGNIQIHSNSAFLEIIKADLVSDQPTDDDMSSHGFTF
jgi:Flp pilus assembly CpaF family ATPase